MLLMSELTAKLNSVETKAMNKEIDLLQIIAKKDEQIIILKAELEEVRQCLADKEKADRELKEAEADRNFRARQQEFLDTLNRYKPGFPSKYKKFYNNIVPRKETKNPGVAESRSPVLGGTSCQGSQSHPCRQNQRPIDVQHHKYLGECKQLELKLQQLRATAPTNYLENKSLKTTSEYSENCNKIPTSPNKPCKVKNVQNPPKNTLKDSKVSGKSKGLVHRSLAPKKKKELQPRPQFSNLNIMSNNIRGLGSRKASLEDILETNDIDICCVQEVNNKNPPKFKNYVQFNRFSKLRMHGVMMLVHNSLRQHVIRVPDESELECVHVRLNHTTPALNIIGLQ